MFNDELDNLLTHASEGKIEKVSITSGKYTLLICWMRPKDAIPSKPYVAIAKWWRGASSSSSVSALVSRRNGFVHCGRYGFKSRNV